MAVLVQTYVAIPLLFCGDVFWTSFSDTLLFEYPIVSASSLLILPWLNLCWVVTRSNIRWWLTSFIVSWSCRAHGVAQYWILFRHLKMVFVVAHFGTTPYMIRPSSLLIGDLAFGLGRLSLLTSLAQCAKPKQRQSSSCEYYHWYVSNVTNPLRFIKKDFSALSQITVRWNTRLTRCPADIIPALCRYAVRYHCCVVRRPHCCFTVRSSSRQSQSYYRVGSQFRIPGVAEIDIDHQDQRTC